MQLSVCILVNEKHPKLTEVVASYVACSSEILLGINGGLTPDDFQELQTVPTLRLVPLLWEGYGPTKNRLAREARNDWIVSVDADELANKELQNALTQIDRHKINNIYAFSMLHFLGTTPLKFGAWGRGKKRFLRVYNRRFTSWDSSDVHESLIQPESAIIKLLPGKIYHYTSKSYDQLLQKNKKYAQLTAEKYFKANKAGFWGKKYISAIFLFLKEYLFYLGFLDGAAGWKVAKGNALYTYWKYDLLFKKRNPKAQ